MATIPVRFIEDAACYALEFGGDAKHAFHAALFLGHGEEGEEIDDLVHQFYVGAGTGVVRVLEDVGEEGNEGGDRIVENEPKKILVSWRSGKTGRLTYQTQE